jgi:uncharacterized membrane protein YfcA
MIATASFFIMGWIDITLFATIFCACVIGGYLGSKLAISMNEALLRYIFLGAIIIMSAIALYS